MCVCCVRCRLFFVPDRTTTLAPSNDNVDDEPRQSTVGIRPSGGVGGVGGGRGDRIENVRRLDSGSAIDTHHVFGHARATIAPETPMSNARAHHCGTISVPYSRTNRPIHPSVHSAFRPAPFNIMWDSDCTHTHADNVCMRVRLL